MFKIDANGNITELPRTPKQEKEFQIFYAGVLETEASKRSGKFADDLRAWAAKARAAADAIDLRPAQGDLFL